MICFPLDITEYEAIALGAWCGTRTRGVFSSDNDYTVTPNGNMSITLGPGLAWLKRDAYWGVNAYSPEATVLTIDTADGSLARYAAVCIRLDKNLNAGVSLVKYGPLGINPAISSLPLPEQSSLDYDEIYVAAVRIRAGATEILASDIFDLRLNETYCGVMRDGVTRIPTQQLYAQWMDRYNEFDRDSQAAYGAFVSRMNAHEAQAAADFVAWFDTVKDTLGEDTAGALLLQIQGLQQRVENQMTFSLFATIPASGWSETRPYTQTINIPLAPDGKSLLEGDRPFVFVAENEDVRQEKAQKRAFGLFADGMTVLSDSMAQAVCSGAKPGIDVQIELRVVR